MVLTPGCVLRGQEVLCGRDVEVVMQGIKKALSLNLLEQRGKTISKMQDTHFSERS